MPGPPKTNDKDQIKWFIDFDKAENFFYNSLYLEDTRVVIKIPLPLNEKTNPRIKLEKFCLSDDVFLISY